MMTRSRPPRRSAGLDGRGRADDAAVAMDGAGVEAAHDADKSDADERTPAQEWGASTPTKEGRGGVHLGGAVFIHGRGREEGGTGSIDGGRGMN